MQWYLYMHEGCMCFVIYFMLYRVVKNDGDKIKQLIPQMKRTKNVSFKQYWNGGSRGPQMLLGFVSNEV